MWVGVFVATVFNLRFGWVLSALVAPGYLVPLLFLRPWAVVVIIFESLITYFIVRSFSGVLSRSGYAGALFGRDRFFAFIIVSVIVRVVFDGWLLLQLGEHLNDTYGIDFDYQNNLHSFGLIIISLLANLFWKTGVLKGIFPLSINIGVTYAIVRYVLIEYTNFRLSGVGYMYEDIAASILASPKAYIILITVAFLASRMNLHYGWEFHGILIPSLIALQWYQPEKVLITMVEALIILFASRWLLSAPVFKNTTMEGGRLLFLCFTISFIYKIALSYFILWVAPAAKITDYFAFGYLLSTLMAVKMYEKDIAPRLSRSVLQISLIGVAIASVIGYLLTSTQQILALEEKVLMQGSAGVAIERREGVKLIDLARSTKVKIYKSKVKDITPIPSQRDVDKFNEGVKALAKYVDTKNGSHLITASNMFFAVGYKIIEAEGKYLCLVEEDDWRGWGFYAVNLDKESSMLVQVPAPVAEWGALEGGSWIYKSLNAKALAIAGAARDANTDGSADVLSNPTSFFFAFYRVFGRANTLQVRGDSDTQKRLQGSKKKLTDSSGDTNILWVKRTLPLGLDVAQMKGKVDTVDLRWDERADTNIIRQETSQGFAELVLTRDTMRTLLFTPAFDTPDVRKQVLVQRIDGYLQDWLLSGKGRIAKRGSGLYVQPRIEEILFFDELIVTPLISIIQNEFSGDSWSEKGLKELKSISSYAHSVGFELVDYYHESTGQRYIILTEKADAESLRYWGTYIFRLGAATPFIIQAPRPLFEINSFEYAVYLFERLKASAILIGGAHPNANTDLSSDIIQRRNKENIFLMINQALIRESGDKPALVIQCRAFGFRRDRPFPDIDAVVAFDNWAVEKEKMGPLGLELIEAFEEDGMAVRVADGSIETAGYEVGASVMAGYLSAMPNKELALLWISPLARASYRQQTENRMQMIKFHAAGITTDTEEIGEYVEKFKWRKRSSKIPDKLISMVDQFIKNKDFILLKSIIANYPEYEFRRLLDINSKQTFMVGVGNGNQLAFVANLIPRSFGKEVLISHRDQAMAGAKKFIETRATWLYVTEDKQ